MQRKNLVMISALGSLLAASAVYGQHQEREDEADQEQEHEVLIQRSDLPPAVEKTVAAEAARATVKGFAREVENGLTYYEAEFVVDGHTRDVLMDSQGNVVEIEEQVPFDKLPATVRRALEARAGSGTIESVESLTKKGKLVAYEALVVTNGNRTEVQVGPDGTTLDREE